jgi:Domain of unknown function (DUF4279)
MDEFTVEFRIHGRDLDVSSVTEALGLEPSLVRHVGERRNGTTKWEEAMWSYNGFAESAGGVTWPSLEDGLRFVLEKLWPIKEVVEGYKRKYAVILWCGHFQSDSNASTTLSPDILKQLGEFAVELLIDTYFSKPQGILDESTE